MPENTHYNTIGTKVEVFYKQGNWLEKTNGKQYDWQLYLHQENRLYTAIHFGDEEIITWKHGGYLNSYGAVVDTDMVPNAEKVLGYDCDKVTLYTAQDTFQYFYSSELPLDYRHFEKCRALRFNVWSRYAQAMPLKMTVSKKGLGRVKFTLTATSVQPMKIEDRVFTMPINGKKTEVDWGEGHMEFLKNNPK